MPSKIERTCILSLTLWLGGTLGTTYREEVLSLKTKQVYFFIYIYIYLGKSFFFFFLQRIFYLLSSCFSRIPPFQRYNASGHQAREPFAWLQRVFKGDRPRYSQGMDSRQRKRHKWYPRIHGTWGHVPTKPWSGCWLLFSGSLMLWVHVWKGELITKKLDFLWVSEFFRDRISEIQKKKSETRF